MCVLIIRMPHPSSSRASFAPADASHVCRVRPTPTRLHKSYSSFNLLVRRKPKENNFKAVLETIRDLMNVDAVGAAVRACVAAAVVVVVVA